MLARVSKALIQFLNPIASSKEAQLEFKPLRPPVIPVSSSEHKEPRKDPEESDQKPVEVAVEEEKSNAPPTLKLVKNENPERSRLPLTEGFFQLFTLLQGAKVLSSPASALKAYEVTRRSRKQGNKLGKGIMYDEK